MSTGTFPYNGKQIQSGSTDANVSALQSLANQIQDVLLGMVAVDPSVKIIAHFDNSLNSHLGLAGTGSGAIRYWSGKFGPAGALVEQGNTNLLPNPSAEVDLTHCAAVDGSAALTRDNQTAYTANNTVSAASFQLAGNSNAGLTYARADTVAVSENTAYSVSAYVYSPVATQAKLELAFTGGTPATYTGSPTTVNAGQWTHLRFEGQNSGNNTSCEVRVYLAQQAPTLAAPSQLSTLAPTATAAVTDAAMTVNAGDLAMCALTANPAGPLSYAWHMVTTGATGVSGTALRLDDAAPAPTFVTGTQFSRLAPVVGDSVLVTDGALAINVGDFVFCNLQGGGYGFHLVTTGATGANNAALRFDDAPAPPAYVAGSRLTRIVPTASALVTDGAMAIAAGDMVYCRPISNPTAGGYGWHVVTTGATGVSSASLRLDNAPNAPTFAAGSRFSKKTPAATGSNTDNAAVLNTGDFAMANPTANPAGSGYGFHMVTTGATGVSSSSLRLDQASSNTIHFDCVQLEAGAIATSFTDSYQGTGFSGAVGSTSARAASSLTWPTSGNLTASAGTLAFWLYPLWAGNDNAAHVLFDMAVGAEQDRLVLVKDNANLLSLTVYDTNGQMKSWTTPAVSFARETWQHVAFTYNAGTVAIYLNGVAQSLTATGAGSGQVTNLAASMYLGTDYTGKALSGAVFDDLVVANAALTADQMSHIGTDAGPYLGLAAGRKGVDTAIGNATTDATPGNQTPIAHGLGVTPSFVQISERANGVVYLSQAADANNFYVKGSAAGVNFDWRASA